MKASDYVFPTLGASGVLQPGSPISNDAVQEMLDRAVKGAGLSERLSTHCFRRGGAQYRFMYAPVGERWTLARIRWWGGWALGESVRLSFFQVSCLKLNFIYHPTLKKDTLIRYLLDELENTEDGHQDALCPTAPEPRTSLLSEHTGQELATKAEVRASHDNLERQVLGISADLKSNCAELVNAVVNHVIPAAFAYFLPPQRSPYPYSGTY